MTSSIAHAKTPIRPTSTGERAPGGPRGNRTALIAGAVALILIAVVLIVSATWRNSAPRPVPVNDPSYSMWPSADGPRDAPSVGADPTTLGVIFSSSVAGSVSAIRFYRTEADNNAHVGRLWSADGRVLAQVLFPAVDRPGWQEVALSRSVRISDDTEYVAGYRSCGETYAADANTLSPQNPRVNRDLTATRGVFSGGSRVPLKSFQGSNYFVDVRFTPGQAANAAARADDGVVSERRGVNRWTANACTSAQPPTTIPAPIPPSSAPASPPPASSTPSTPTPSASTDPTPRPAPTPTPKPSPTPPQPPTGPPATGGFPAAATTGVPAGTATTTYSGPLTITADGTSITNKVINGDLDIRASNVTITNSLINGTVSNDGGGSVIIVDSEVDGGTSQTPAVGYRGVTLKRVEVRGARVSVLCGSNCLIQDSWLHAQYLKPGSDWHVNGYLSNGGSNVVLRHNTLSCDPNDNSNGGGCTGPAASFGDFSALSNITYDSNLFRAGPGGYCLAAGYNPTKPYGSNPSGVTVINNVFERGSGGKCGYYGPVTAFLNAGGNVWNNNVWQETLAAIRPAQ